MLILFSFTDGEGVTHTIRYIADDKGYRVIGRSSTLTGTIVSSATVKASASAKAAADAKAAAAAKAAAEAAAAARASAQAQSQKTVQTKTQVSSSVAVSNPCSRTVANGGIIDLELNDQSHHQGGDAGNAVQGSYA